MPWRVIVVRCPRGLVTGGVRNWQASLYRPVAGVRLTSPDAMRLRPGALEPPPARDGRRAVAKFGQRGAGV